MKTKETMICNGVKYERRYALYDFGLDRLDDEIEWARPELVTDDPMEITAQVGGCEEDDEKWCVEIYWAYAEGDNAGEFAEGSDFDTATHFYEQNHIEEGLHND